MSTLLIRPLLFLLLLGASVAEAEVYRWIDAAGNVQYSDRKPAAVEAERVVVDAHPAVSGPSSAVPAPAAPAPVVANVARSPTPPSIRMYLSPSCGYCTLAARFFDARGVPWRGEDITKSQIAKLAFEQAGGRGTPLIIVDGQAIHGFQKERLDRLLAQRGW